MPRDKSLGIFSPCMAAGPVLGLADTAMCHEARRWRGRTGAPQILEEGKTKHSPVNGAVSSGHRDGRGLHAAFAYDRPRNFLAYYLAEIQVGRDDLDDAK
jgi:hypothetical protein